MIEDKIYDDVRRDRDRWKALAKSLQKKIEYSELEASRSRRSRAEEAARAPGRLGQLFGRINAGEEVMVEAAVHRSSS